MFLSFFNSITRKFFCNNFLQFYAHIVCPYNRLAYSSTYLTQKRTRTFFLAGNQNPLFCFCYLLMASFKNTRHDTRPDFVWNDYDCFSAVLFLEVLFRSFLLEITIRKKNKIKGSQRVNGENEKRRKKGSLNKNITLITCEFYILFEVENESEKITFFFAQSQYNGGRYNLSTNFAP